MKLIVSISAHKNTLTLTIFDVIITTICHFFLHIYGISPLKIECINNFEKELKTYHTRIFFSKCASATLHIKKKLNYRWIQVKLLFQGDQ